jgi:hypothetical protein
LLENRRWRGRRQLGNGLDRHCRGIPILRFLDEAASVTIAALLVNVSELIREFSKKRFCFTTILWNRFY